MAGGAQACARVRNLTQSLALLRADTFGHGAPPRKARQATLRLPFRRQAHTTLLRGPCFHPYCTKQDKRSSAPFHSSASTAHSITPDRDGKPQDVEDDKHLSTTGPGADQDVLTRSSDQITIPGEDFGDGPISSGSEPHLASQPTQQLAWAGDNPGKAHALESWISLKHAEGWRFTLAFTPSDEEHKSRNAWCDMDVDHLPTRRRWSASAKGSSKTKAREDALELLLSKIGEEVDWSDMSKEIDEIKFLQMVLSDRLTLENKYEAPHWFLIVNAPGSSMPFKLELPTGKRIHGKGLLALTRKLIPTLQTQGVWSDILDTLLKEPETESPEHTDLEFIDQPLLNETEEPVSKDPELPPTEMTERLPPMTLEKAVQAVLSKNEQRRDFFHKLMAIGRLSMETRVSTRGVKTCLATYKERYSFVQVSLQDDPSDSVPRSLLEKRASRLLVAKLYAFKILSTDLHSSSVWPDCKLFLSDDMIWAMRSIKDQLHHARLSMCISDPKQDPQSELIPQTPKPSSPSQITTRSKHLSGLLGRQRASKDPKAVAIQSIRAQLPVSQIGNEILELVKANTYSVISAETGSGKSTQVPQILLDDAIDQGIGGTLKILCVQPRRIAAQLLAKRVAEERNQPVGLTVGSIVRFDYQEPNIHGGTITYCTTGILLNYLQHNSQKLESLTHIILDEVHVRDLSIDFTMLLLKRFVDRCRATGTREPRIVIMSATVDIDLFTSYFRNVGPDGTLIPAPHISIPGRHHYVKKHYLADIIDDLKASLDPDLLQTLLREPQTYRFLLKHFELHAESELPPVQKRASPLAQPRVEENPDEFVPFGLASALVSHILTSTETGSILIFLPGMAWIEALKIQLETFINRPDLGLDFSDENKFRILQLHADLPGEMEKLSLPVPEGCRRILLSTDITEASVTLPDVKYVIDTGKANQIQFNTETRGGHLECSWTSRSSAIQRQGRAGRVQNGEYFFLGLKRCYDRLRSTRSAAIQRTDLSDACLRTKSLVPGISVGEVLQETIEPPDTQRVCNTVEALKQLKAFDENENITNLGTLLSKFELDPKSAKLVLLGLIFQCLDPLLIIAVAQDSKSLFPLGYTLEEREQIRKARAKFAQGTSSDHLAEVNAFNALRTEWKKSKNQAYQLAVSNNLRFSSYKENFDAAALILEKLSKRLLIPSYAKFLKMDQFGLPIHNINSGNISLIKALIAHCLSGQIVAPKPLSKYFYYSSTESSLSVRGVSASIGKDLLPKRNFIAYSSKRDSLTNPMAILSNVTPASSLAVCLLGGRLVWKDQKLRMNDWLWIEAHVENGAFTKEEALRSFFEFRRALDQSLAAVYDSYVSTSRDPKERAKMEKSRIKLLKTLQEGLAGIFQQYDGRSAPHTQPTQWDVHSLQNFRDEWATEEDEEERKAMDLV